MMIQYIKSHSEVCLAHIIYRSKSLLLLKCDERMKTWINKWMKSMEKGAFICPFPLLILLWWSCYSLLPSLHSDINFITTGNKAYLFFPSREENICLIKMLYPFLSFPCHQTACPRPRSLFQVNQNENRNSIKMSVIALFSQTR